ncbi:aldo/keto reductase [Geomesophilobacter sediminis]|uniref:Aldo/keto reductase n=1 Tax=Geomesophilobacter sediminis TaxID=2798584 RepID=A0A8J7JES5_9BACT|nr:aldo/keto reductase [Geomesophilobacter sediminis]MBJ6724644.1 aldo/keto reductase [Geomesophilobacter sediminis]
MNYKVLGNTGVLVSELCFGTMTFGSEADEAESARLFNRCREAGINFFDCANNYGDGRAEIILGNLIRDCRDEVFITSKVSQRVGKDINALGSSRRHIMWSIDQSLARLKTDRIDLYFIHHFDPLTPMEETLSALDDLVHQGKVLYLGVSNWAAWQIAKALGISGQKGWARFACIEPMYNLVKRQAEVEILPLALSEKLGVIPYSPLGGGLLTGKYSGSEAPAAGRIAEKKQYNLRYSSPRYYETVERFTHYAQELGVKPATLAVSWVMSHPAVSAPIIGARNLAQLEDSLAAADFAMTAEVLQRIGEFSEAPGNATDRLEEEIDASFKLRNR